MKKHLEIFFHLLFWLFSLWLLNMAFAMENIEIFEVNGERSEEITRDFRLFPLVLVVLFGKMLWAYCLAFWGLPGFLKNQNWQLAALRILGLLLAIVVLESALAKLVTDFDPQLYGGEYLGLWQLNAMFFIGYFGVAMAYGLAKNWWKNEQLLRQLEREKLSTELDYLRSQVNPHFLFNTLNNLYALAEREGNSDLGTGIAELSNLMRYMLHGAKAELVPLDKEIRHLRSIIEIQQLRFSEEDDLAVLLNVKGDLAGRKIAPLILIPFVENAFKHGVDLQRSSFIKIDLDVQPEQIIFRVKNSNFGQQTPTEHQHSGIGLDNVRRRLELLYPGRHGLEISGREGVFLIELKISD